MRTRPLLLASAVLAASLGSLGLGHSVLAGTARPASPASPAGPAGPAGVSLQPWPVTITIRTVPALAGVRFTFDGTTLVTGRGGVAKQTERHNFSQHTLSLLDTRINKPSRRYTFARWAGQRDPNQAFLPTVRGLPMRADYTVTAAFGAACPVTPHFTDQHGAPLDPARITQVSIRSNAGRTLSLSPSGTTWIPCMTTVYAGSTLRKRPVHYSVQSVMISGTDVVHAGVERLWPERTPDPAVVGYFHDLTVTAHDALFGGGTGTVALVTLPDHVVRRVALGAGHAATLRNLPQGEYRVNVKAGSAVISGQTLRLSKDRTVNFTAVSAADLATVGGIVLVVVLGLPLMSGARRRRVLGLLRRHREEAAPA